MRGSGRDNNVINAHILESECSNFGWLTLVVVEAVVALEEVLRDSMVTGSG